jgi:hypothetical protein
MIEVNYLGVLLAAVGSMVVGFAWYSPSLFGKQWMKLMGYTTEKLKKEQKEMGKWYSVSFVLSLITAYVLAHVMALSQNFYHNPGVMTGLMTAFWSWFGFMMPVQMTGEIFGGKNWGLFAINTSYQLVSLLVMGIILGSI